MIANFNKLNDMENTGLFNSDGKELSLSDVINTLPTSMINRVEVIDEKGRSYVNWKPTNKVKLLMQDDGRTLKIYISEVSEC